MNRTAAWLLLAIIFCFSSIHVFAQKSHKTDWFKKAGYGIIVHYLHRFQNTTPPMNMGKHTSWDSCVNEFNVKRFAADVAETGAHYVIFTTQQNDQYFSCPNTTYERLTGYKRGTATPRRDLINELHYALKAKGIALMLYVTGNGPYKDEHAINAMNNKTLASFVATWSKVLRDISLRYKSKIKGWWVDGAYPFLGYNDTLLTKLRTALKAGNKQAIIAFNQAPKDSVSFYTSLDDYTAGEMYHIHSLPHGRFIKGVQWHAMTFLGKDWGEPGSRYDEDQLKNYLQECNKRGGVVTFDISLMRNGSLDEQQKALLKKVKYRLK